MAESGLQSFDPNQDNLYLKIEQWNTTLDYVLRVKNVPHYPYQMNRQKRKNRRATIILHQQMTACICAITMNKIFFGYMEAKRNSISQLEKYGKPN